MNRLLSLLLISGLAWTACTKESTIPSSSSTVVSNYIPLTVGSYWVYDWYLVDSAGNAVFLNRTDSVSVVGDTLVGMDTFVITEGGWFGGLPSRGYSRDSSGYLIGLSGRIYFSATNFTDTLYTWHSGNGNETGYLKMDSVGGIVTVPAGTFSTLNAKYTVVNNVGSWPCLGTLDIHDNQYADGVGKVRSTFQYANDVFCRVHEQRLRAYYIAP